MRLMRLLDLNQSSIVRHCHLQKVFQEELLTKICFTASNSSASSYVFVVDPRGSLGLPKMDRFSGCSQKRKGEAPFFAVALRQDRIDVQKVALQDAGEQQRSPTCMV